MGSPHGRQAPSSVCRAETRLCHRGCHGWHSHVGWVSPAGDRAVTRAASHRGDEPVLQMHQDKRGQEAPQQSGEGPHWFKSTWPGHNQRDKHRNKAKSTWRGKNQEAAPLS